MKCLECNIEDITKFGKYRKLCNSCRCKKDAAYRKERYKNEPEYRESKKRRAKENVKKNLMRFRFTQARSRAFKKGLEFNITEQYLNEILQKQNNKCVYSGIQLDNNSKYYSMSIDRIDSNKGYTENNIQFTAYSVNIMKNNLPEVEFLLIVKSIYNNKLNN